MKPVMWRVTLQHFLSTKRLPLVLNSLVVFLVVGALFGYYQFTSSHLPPNTYIDSIPVGGLSFEEAAEKLTTSLPILPSSNVSVEVEGISVASSTAELGMTYQFQAILTQLQQQSVEGSLLDQLIWRIKPLLSAQHYQAALAYDPEKTNRLLELLNQKVTYQGATPSAKLVVSGNANSLEIFPGQKGRAIDLAATQAVLSAQIPPVATLLAVVASTSGELTEAEVAQSLERAKKFVGKSITFTFENQAYLIADKQLISYLALPDGYDLNLIATKVVTLAAEINRDPQEPVFEYNPDTLQIAAFSAPRDGQKLNEQATIIQLQQALQDLEATLTGSEAENQSYELLVATTPPTKSLGETNRLGIQERIGFGDSHYNHSIPNRIHNVGLTTSRVSNTLVAPGAEFSFNKTLGDVSAETGFRSAYVIKNGQTALGDGGGVCQVSTTVFRSVLNAGLKVTRRIPHSYRVSYYELDKKPGVDATVYAGNTDFRFVNDTDHYVLLHGEADSRKLYMFFEIYGTSDGRTAEIVDHKTWNYRPAPAPEYIPDPSLPPGKLQQVDWAASGISASFVNVIKDKFGTVIREDKYTSNYRPWSAKYLQGVAQ